MAAACGLAVAVAEACWSGPATIGAVVELPPADPIHLGLFGEGPSRIVVSVPAQAERHFERLMGEFQAPWRWIGRVGVSLPFFPPHRRFILGRLVGPRRQDAGPAAEGCPWRPHPARTT